MGWKIRSRILPMVVVVGLIYVSSLSVIESLWKKNQQHPFVDYNIASLIDSANDDVSNTKKLNQISPYSLLEYDRSGISTAITLWCQDQVFQFKHVLTLLSIIRILKSDVIWIMFERFPKSDYYNNWLKDVSSQFPFLKFEKCKRCCVNSQKNSGRLMQILTRKGGGIIVNFGVIITKMTADVYNLHGFTIKDNEGNIQVLMIKPILISYLYKKVNGGFTYVGNQSVVNQVSQVPGIKCHSIINNKRAQTNSHSCYDLYNYNGALYPKDIWYSNSSFCGEIRTLLYNSSQIVTPLKSLSRSPKILHYIWFGHRNSEMTFMFYLSVLSFINIGGVDKIYLHCDNSPVGYYWNKLNENNFIHIVYRTKPQSVFNQTVNVVQHMADIVKADISFKYGGIIADTDVILVKPLDSNLFLYDFVVGRDIGDIKNFPDAVNMGIIISKPGNKFSEKWTNSMKIFEDGDWLWNAGLSTYKIIEKYPHLVHMTDHLQVICYRYTFYPTWNPRKEHHNLNATKYSTLTKWIEKTHSFHFTFPEPYTSMSALKDEQGLTGQVGRYVARQIGLL